MLLALFYSVPRLLLEALVDRHTRMLTRAPRLSLYQMKIPSCIAAGRRYLINHIWRMLPTVDQANVAGQLAGGWSEIPPGPPCLPSG